MSAAEVAGQASLTGATALILATIGLEPQAIVWGLVGSVLGVALAKPSTRLYSAVLFLAATLTCALLGSVLAAEYFAGKVMPRNITIVAIGVAFHPLLQAFIAAIPDFVSWLIGVLKRRFGGTT